MSKSMGTYCKAYPIRQLRQFSQWSEQTKNTRKIQQVVNSQTVEVNRTITEDDFLYLQENYVVTDGIFLDENVIFDEVSSEWIAFCKDILKFEPTADTTKIAEISATES